MELKKAWSYSALSEFETCPRRYYLTRVSKEVVEAPSEVMQWGNKVHKSLELYAKENKPLPKELASYQRYVDKLFERPGKKIIEQKLTIDQDFRPTSWFAKNAWCRGIVDIGVLGDDTAHVLDWKTGKRRPDSDQMKLFAAMVFASYPWIDRVATGFVWLKSKQFDKELFTRDQVTEIWADFLPRTARLDETFKKDKWVPKPSGLCREWCPVGRKLCEFCGV